MDVLLHGILRRYVLMGCMWVVYLIGKVKEKALHGVRWEFPSTSLCVRRDQHGVEIGGEDSEATWLASQPELQSGPLPV